MKSVLPYARLALLICSLLLMLTVMPHIVMAENAVDTASGTADNTDSTQTPPTSPENAAPASAALTERNELVNKGFEAHKLQDYSSAAAIFESILALKLTAEEENLARPSRLEISRLYYDSLKKSEQHNRAFIVLQGLGKEFPADAFIHRELGKLYLANGNPDRALSEYEGVCNHEPADQEACTQAAYLHMKNNDFDSAMRCMRGVVKDSMEPSPSAEEVKGDIGDLPLAQQRYELVKFGYQASARNEHIKAANLYHSALKIRLSDDEERVAEPQRSQISLALYYSYKSAGETEKAESHLKEMGAEFSEHDIIQREYGYYLLNRQDQQSALKSFDGICRRNPENRDDCMQAYYIYMNLGQEQTAIGTLQGVLYHHPDDVQARKEMGWLQVKNGENEKAIENFEFVISKSPEERDIHLQLAYLYKKQNRLDDARREIEWILEREPEGHHDLRLELAYIKVEDAKKDLQTVSQQEEDKDSQQRAEKSLESMAQSEEEVRIKEKSEERKLSDIFFGDVYLHAFFTSRNPNLIFTGKVREGIQIPVVPMKVYAGLRLTRDIRSKGFLTSEIYEDNVMVPMLGVEVAPLQPWVPSLGFVLLYEIGAAIALYDAPDQVMLDMRGGLAMNYEWQHTRPVKNDKGKLIWPLTFFGDFYTDILWYYRFQNNWIGFFTIKEGLNLLQYGMLLQQLYLKANLKYDVDGVFYNNAVEFGPGARVMPWDWLYLQFYTEMLFGFYIPRNGPEKNPYDGNYYDFRIGALFSYYW